MMDERWVVAPVCIASMHRSGTSTDSQLLHRCGLYLGQESEIHASDSDNPDGYWEHKGFRSINERILKIFGGGWDLPPPLPLGWTEDRRLQPLRSEAERLLDDFAEQRQWGWKDPRNSLTLPFWTGAVPEVKVVVCVRNPLEVALSLRRHAMSSYAFSFNLWCLYNQRLLDALPADRFIVTHYETYFYRPTVELRRVLDFLGVPASDQLVARARSTTLKNLRHHRVTTSDLEKADAPPELLGLYSRMCRLAGWEEEHPSVFDKKFGTAANMPLA